MQLVNSGNIQVLKKRGGRENSEGEDRITPVMAFRDTSKSVLPRSAQMGTSPSGAAKMEKELKACPEPKRKDSLAVTPNDYIRH